MKRKHKLQAIECSVLNYPVDTRECGRPRRLSTNSSSPPSGIFYLTSSDRVNSKNGIATYREFASLEKTPTVDTLLR